MQQRKSPHNIVVIDPVSGALASVLLRWPAALRGVTGISAVGDVLLAGIQAGHANQIVTIDPMRWRIVDTYTSPHIRDIHTFLPDEGGVLVVSSGDNAIYRLHVEGGRIRGEELHWRYPGTRADADDVHLNALTEHGGRVVASCFGPRTPEGHWAQSDGHIFDVASGQVLLGGLGHPHTVISDGSRLHVCESRTGKLFSGAQTDGNWSWRETALWGYTRGILAGTGEQLVGISVSRKVSRIHDTPVHLNVQPFGRCQIARVVDGGGEAAMAFDLTRFGEEV